MSNFYEKLARSADGGSGEYVQAYMTNVKDIFAATTSPASLKSYICTEDIEQADSYLRFSLVLNDLTLLSTGGFRQLQMIWLTRDWFEKALELQSATIEVSGSKLRELNIDPEDPQFAVGFVFP